MTAADSAAPHFAGLGAEWDYDDLAAAARAWIAAAFDGAPPAAPPLAGIAAALTRRRFAEFRRLVPVRTSLESALVELFLLARLRGYALAYLTVQEGEPFEGEPAYETQVPPLIAEFLRGLGERSLLSVGRRVLGVNLSVSLDPFIHLRRIYALLVTAPDPARLSAVRRLRIGWHRAAFRLKSMAAGAAVRHLLGGGRRRSTADHLTALFRRPELRRLIALFLLVLFADARDLTAAEWPPLLDRIEAYFVPRLTALAAVIPDFSVAGNGLIKLVKVAFGTVAGRTAARGEHPGPAADFIFDSLRLAYSWGVTYPLVDNILDSGTVTDAVRTGLTDAIAAVFRDRPSVPPDDPCAREVCERLAEVVGLVPAAHRPAARRTLGLLVESHRRDSRRRLALLPADDGPGEEDAVLADTALKAALVRLATMAVCGIRVEHRTLLRAVVGGLFNQLGDDLWDIYEDYADGRVTPFTLYLTRGGRRNPFELYLNAGVEIGRGQSRRRRTAALLGFCESLRDVFLSFRRPGGDSLRVQDAVAQLLDVSGGTVLTPHLGTMPHVDFDAVLFAFEAALLPLLDR